MWVQGMPGGHGDSCGSRERETPGCHAPGACGCVGVPACSHVTRKTSLLLRDLPRMRALARGSAQVFSWPSRLLTLRLALVYNSTTPCTNPWSATQPLLASFQTPTVQSQSQLGLQACGGSHTMHCQGRLAGKSHDAWSSSMCCALDCAAASQPCDRRAGSNGAGPSTPPEADREADGGALDIVPPARGDEEHLAGLQHAVCRAGSGQGAGRSWARAVCGGLDPGGAPLWAQALSTHTACPPPLFVVCLLTLEGRPVKERKVPKIKAFLVCKQTLPRSCVLTLKGRPIKQREAAQVGAVDVHAAAVGVHALGVGVHGRASRGGVQPHVLAAHRLAQQVGVRVGVQGGDLRSRGDRRRSGGWGPRNGADGAPLIPARQPCRTRGEGLSAVGSKAADRA